MTVRWKGNKGIQLRSIDRNWTRERGWVSVYIYTGEWSLIDAAKTNSVYTGYASDIAVTRDSNLGELRVTFSNTDNTEPDLNNEQSNTWTFTPYKVQKNIEEHPNYVGLAEIASEEGYLQRVLLSTENYKTKVAAGIEAQNTDKDLQFDLSDYVTKKGTAAQQTLADELALLILRGHTTYDVTKYTIRNVKVVPAGTNLTVNHVGTETQWSTAQLVDLILSGPPTVTQSSIIGDMIGVFPADKWLKDAPNITEINNGKFEISNEWVNQKADELPTEIYPDFTG